jgi:hypothetical protein
MEEGEREETKLNEREGKRGNVIVVEITISWRDFT